MWSHWGYGGYKKTEIKLIDINVWEKNYLTGLID